VPCATSAQERLRNTVQRPRPARRAARTQDLAGNLGDAVRSALRATIETIARVMTAEACGTAALDALALARCTGADLAGGMVNGRLRGFGTDLPSNRRYGPVFLLVFAAAQVSGD